MIYTSFSFLALRLTVYVVSETLDDESSQLIAPLQKARSIFVSLDAMIDVIIFFKHYFITTKPKKKTAVRGAQMYQNNIAQRQSSLENPESSSLGNSHQSNVHHSGNDSSENMATEHHVTASNSIIAKVKASFHRQESVETDAENEPRRFSLGSVDENHNGQDLHPHSSIMSKVKASFHRKESMESDAENDPMHPSSLGSIDEEHNNEGLHSHSSIMAKVKASFHRKDSTESDTNNEPRVEQRMRSSLSPVKEERSGEDLHPIRVHVVKGNESFTLPKWIVKEYATDLHTENAFPLDPMVEEA